MDSLAPFLKRIAEAFERVSPAPHPEPDLSKPDAFLWQAESDTLQPVKEISRVDMNLLQGIDLQRDILLANTRQFAKGLPANNALLWGARGMGKSSLVKASHAAVNAASGMRLKLIEIHREDID